MIEQTKILLWRTLAALSIALGVIGVVLPVMPTVPFMLLAAWAGSKGWPELESWLLAHPVFGPQIKQWRDHGAVSRKAKILACTMMTGSATMLWFMPVPDLVRWVLYPAFALIGLWLCWRPEPASAMVTVKTD
jgi:uncharacterized membrane protein YbaN (DUF454 family)